MYCPICNHPVSVRALFCGKCSTVFDAETSPIEAKKGIHKKRGIGYVLAIGLMIAPLAYFGALWFFGGSLVLAYAVSNPILLGLAIATFFAGVLLWSGLPEE